MPARKTKNTKRIVIDASIARSSGSEDAASPVSKKCREVLETILKYCHHVIMTQEIRIEWENNQSNFARSWLVSMRRQGRKVTWIEVEANERLREKIPTFAAKETDRDAMLKDVLLLEAAQASDKIVISLDETVRNLFKALTSNVGEIRDIIWVNPTIPEEKCIQWLNDNCPEDDHRKLGYVDNNE